VTGATTLSTGDLLTCAARSAYHAEMDLETRAVRGLGTALEFDIIEQVVAAAERLLEDLLHCEPERHLVALELAIENYHANAGSGEARAQA
jgi:predicted metal-dependent hydrolase